MPWIVGLAFAATLGVVALFRLRQIRNLRARIKDGSKGIDDTWDPFT